jgi:hypothetical protein
MTTSPPAAGSPPLKHLGVLPNTISQATSAASAGYTKLRQTVPLPGPLEGYFKAGEDFASQYGAPVVTAASDYGSKVLQFADGTVDTHVRNVSGVYSKGIEVHGESMKHFYKAKQDSFGLVERIYEFVKQVINPVPYINAVLDPVKDAVRSSLSSSNPDAYVDWVRSRLQQVASLGPVPKVLKAADPYQKKAAEAAGAVVSHTYYKQAVDTGVSVASKLGSFVSSTWFYKKGAELFWPQVAFVAEPLYEKINSSKYVNDLIGAIKPKAS